MRKLIFFLTPLLSFAALFAAFNSIESAKPASSTSPNLVISQFQAGGTSNANDEFIEIHNIGPSPVDLNGYRVVYRSSSGTSDVGPMAAWNSTTILQPGQFYLIASTSYTGSAAPDLTYDPTTCTCSLSASAGGLAIRQGNQNTGTIIDAVGWGNATNIFFEGTRTTAPPNSSSKARDENGCKDTDNNSADFLTLTPSAPRNSSSPSVQCGSAGTTLFAAFAANPSSLPPGAQTLLTVTVVPATTPPSTGIAVAGNLTSIGGSASQTFYDDGTNGDVTAGDNVFSFLATIPANSSGGNRTLTATASDAQGRTVNLNETITVNAPLPNEDPLIFGNPSGATPDVANENNYLMPKPQYTLSYNRMKGTANWVGWRLASNWIGSTPRQDNFRPDTSLPNGWYQVTSQDYSGSGYDRGHMCPSGDRTNSVENNSATFLMTNMVPQLAANNQGPWEDFESYCRTLASQGNELYIFSGPVGSLGTIAQGRVTIPEYTWKVVLVLPNGDNDVSRVTKATRTIGIIVPNFGPLDINAPWRNFRVSVDQVERLTDYDFFNVLPKLTQETIERRKDRQ